MYMYIYAALLCDFILVDDIVINHVVYEVHLHTSLQEGWTALMKASSNRHDECVDINQTNKVSAVSQSIIVCLACSFVWKWLV